MNRSASLLFPTAWLAVAALAPRTAAADVSALGPVTCTQLATDLAGVPTVKSATSQIVAVSGPNVAFCQVDILLGVNAAQNIKIRLGLPLNSVNGGSGGVQGAWNGRTQGVGGFGCSGNLDVSAPVNTGYVGSGNDTGHPGPDCEPGVNADRTYNFQFINDFIRNGIKAQVLFSKVVATRYYGRLPAHNYWNGCSTGGRQGYLLAQELGTELDGILANAPAIYWTRFQTAQMWGQIAMKDLVGSPIAGAKLDQTGASAVAACDANDGVIDGVIDDPRTCTFSATANICGAPTAPPSNCLTPAEAAAINLIWDGPRNAGGNKVWFGLDRGTTLGDIVIPLPPPAPPIVIPGLDGAMPFPLGVTQFHWDEHNLNFDWHTVLLRGYPQVAQDGSRNIADVTDSFANLDLFRAAGGKLMTFVGGNDQLIMPRGIINYYRQMGSRYGGGSPVNFGPVQNFYRLFRAPGVGHCGGGSGPQPLGLFEALVDWVENGHAPSSILAQTFGAPVTTTRPLCPYPQTAIYNGTGSTNDASNFHCGGNLETTTTVCKDVVVKYKSEVNGALDFSGSGVTQRQCQ